MFDVFVFVLKTRNIVVFSLEVVSFRELCVLLV